MWNRTSGLVRAGLALLLLAASFPGSAAAQNGSEAAPANDLDFLVGEWTPALDNSWVHKNPSGKGMVTISYHWGPQKKFLRMTNQFPLGGDRWLGDVQGIVVWHPVEKKWKFTGANQRGMVYEGEYKSLGPNRVERVYRAHYPAGAPFLPNPQLGGQSRLFREVLAAAGPDALDTTLEIQVGDEWKPWGPGKFPVVRVNSPAAERAAAKGSPLAALEAYVGEWVHAEEDPLLRERPEFRNVVVLSMVWGPRKDSLRMYEGYPAGGNPAAAALEGMVYWNPVDGKIKFVASTRWGWVFEGEYKQHADGRLERVYTVYYPEGINDWIPEPDLGGQTRTFREIYSFNDSGQIQFATEILKGGTWAPWGKSAVPFSLVRVKQSP